MNPTLYIISGPYGAGKTTASLSTLPAVLDCDIFINADEIARGLSPINPDRAAFRAGRIMLEMINENLQEANTFALETTLSTKSYKGYIEKAKTLGYRVVMIFIYLESSELAIHRVKRRVEEGGHDIPKHVIIRRYNRGLENLKSIFTEMCDEITIAHGQNNINKTIAIKNDNEWMIYDQRTFNKIFEK